MLERMSHVGGLKNKLQTVTSGARSLQLSMQRIRAEVLQPFKHMQSRTIQLRRMQATANLLRRILRLLFAIGKLRSQTKRIDQKAAGGLSTRELCKAAQSLRDVETLMKSEALRGIDIVSRELEWVKAA